MHSAIRRLFNIKKKCESKNSDVSACLQVLYTLPETMLFCGAGTWQGFAAAR
jgi:hypothetical protein